MYKRKPIDANHSLRRTMEGGSQKGCIGASNASPDVTFIPHTVELGGQIITTLAGPWLPTVLSTFMKRRVTKWSRIERRRPT